MCLTNFPTVYHLQFLDMQAHTHTLTHAQARYRAQQTSRDTSRFSLVEALLASREAALRQAEDAQVARGMFPLCVCVCVCVCGI